MILGTSQVTNGMQNTLPYHTSPQKKDYSNNLSLPFP